MMSHGRRFFEGESEYVIESREVLIDLKTSKLIKKCFETNEGKICFKEWEDGVNDIMNDFLNKQLKVMGYLIIIICFLYCSEFIFNKIKKKNLLEKMNIFICERIIQRKKEAFKETKFRLSKYFYKDISNIILNYSNDNSISKSEYIFEIPYAIIPFIIKSFKPNRR